MDISTLRLFSIIYLLVPNLFFFAYWTNPFICLAGIALLGYQLYREVRDKEFTTADRISGKDLLSVGLLSLVIILFSGIGGFAYQTVDHWAHNVKFYELYLTSWPLVDQKSDSIISYYFGYYVVPAVIFKMFGGVSGIVMIAWAWAGLFLGLLWISSILKGKIWLLPVVICAGDLVHFFVSSLKLLSIDLYHYKDFRIGFWSAYESFFWAPNQVIPALLLAGMLVYMIEHETDLLKMVFPISLSFWWAVFPGFFIAVYVIVLVILKLLKNPRLFAGYLLRSDVWIPVLTCIPVFIFYMSKQSYPVSGWAWGRITDFGNFFREYALNIVVNLSFLLGVYFFFRKRIARSLPLYPLIVLVFLTILFSFYQGGELNDFLFRGMIPFLVIFGIYMVYPLSGMTFRQFTLLIKGSKTVGAVVIFVLCATLFLGISRTTRALVNNRLTASAGLSSFNRIPFDKYSRVYDVLVDYWSEEGAQQYQGMKGSFYEKYIAPKNIIRGKSDVD